MIRGVVFDLDDTLYDERDYVRSGFRAVAASLGGPSAAVEARFRRLWTDFEAGARGDAFDRLLADDADARERTDVATLVDVYRGHAPTIAFAPGVETLLDGLRAAGRRLGLLTDGSHVSQAAKVAALGLERWMDPIILTDRLGPTAHKPGLAGFEAIARAWALSAGELVYVADNPAKDFIGPRRLGWTTIRLRRPAQLRVGLEATGPEAAPDLGVGTLDELAVALGVPPGAAL